MATAIAKPPPAIQKLFVPASVMPNGTGGFVVTPKKPVQEISAAEASKLLGICRQSLCLAIDSRLGQKHLNWRWSSERKGKRLFTVDSVVAYKEALEEEGK